MSATTQSHNATLRHVGFVLRSNPVTAIAAAGLLAIVLLALAAPWIAPYDPIAIGSK